ncbi:hypothetical protein BJ878DRAFT_451516 [Calycina marina]|uniref:Diphthine--ammonia ligase n=1 Tax=Calycina marina TaxID=1763456 RepID=A0A9P8CJ06_9HELO|nr:hypothetical protein BJ878DRAFT_451516 [Calycina marina]
MTDSLNVIALISGGKDSFYSILHCLQNGHQVVALGNLFPGQSSVLTSYPTPSRSSTPPESSTLSDAVEESDLNSFMYQTIGHTVIPLYEQALGLPLYRQEITGTAVQAGITYSHGDSADETESLIPLLKTIMAKDPTANALSTGAILSTYQRTRIESVALRLGLTPLSYLWQYPILPPGNQTSLLHDMQGIGLDARIIKVASGGLDESFLWENVASAKVVRRMDRALKRFGMDGNGAVLGEGGEFETLVIDGPGNLFKGRIEIKETDRKIVREGGGSSWLRILDAKVVMKDQRSDVVGTKAPRELDALEARFKEAHSRLTGSPEQLMDSLSLAESHLQMASLRDRSFQEIARSTSQTYNWTVFAEGKSSLERTITQEAEAAIAKMNQLLADSSLSTQDITSAIIILRSMQDFASINKVYGSLFIFPNPPARVTISAGSLLPANINMLIHLVVHRSDSSLPQKRALHVQSRSYWAPANIGPYSQAISIPIPSTNDEADPTFTVAIAGQIPLLPASMVLPSPSSKDKTQGFTYQTVLGLQHLFRIGIATKTTWFTSVVAYLSHSSPSQSHERACIAAQAWRSVHIPPADRSSDDEDDPVRDLWEEKFHAGMEIRGGSDKEIVLPNWELAERLDGEGDVAPPFFAAEVEELPRGSDIEWHAHLGIAGARVTVEVREKNNCWTIYKSRFEGREEFVIIIAYTTDKSTFKRWREEALAFIRVEGEGVVDVYLTYLDVTTNEHGSVEGSTSDYKGLVPCRSLRDKSGRRLSAVLLLHNIS